MAGLGALEAAGFDATGSEATQFGAQSVQPGGQEFEESLRTAQLTTPVPGIQLAQAPMSQPQESQPIRERPPVRPAEAPGNVIRPNIPHWNGPPLPDLARQRGLIGAGGGIGTALALAAEGARGIGFRALMGRDVDRLARDTGIVLDTANNPYHRAIAQEYTENLGNSELGRLYRAPMTREQALGVLQYRLAELETQPPAQAETPAREPVADGMVRLQIGAVTYAMPADAVRPDPTCHPNGFWAPDPSYPNTRATYPDAARYQDQINGGRIGLNYYVPISPNTVGTPVSGTMAVQSYDGCITPQSALTGAPAVSGPTLVEAKHWLGSSAFLQRAQREGFLPQVLGQSTRQAESQMQNAGGTPMAWFISREDVLPYFRQALTGTGAGVQHEPLR